MIIFTSYHECNVWRVGEARVHLHEALFVSNCQARLSIRDRWQYGVHFTFVPRMWLFGLFPKDTDLLLYCCRCGVTAESREACYDETSSPSLSLSHVWESRRGQRSLCSALSSHIWKKLVSSGQKYFSLHLRTWSFSRMILLHNKWHRRWRVLCRLTCCWKLQNVESM